MDRVEKCVAIGIQSIGGKPKRRRELYNGHSNILYEGSDPSTLVFYFKDDLNSGEKKQQLAKGIINNRFSELMMSRLCSIGVDTHLIERLNMREQLVYTADPLSFRVKVHNFSNMDFSNRSHFEPWTALPQPVFEFVTKGSDDAYHVIGERHVESFGWADEEEIETIFAICQRINDFMQGQFLAYSLRLINFKVEFGRVYFGDFMEQSKLAVIGSLGLDRFELTDLNSMGQITTESSYLEAEGLLDFQEIANRFGVLHGAGPVDLSITV